MNLLPKTLVGRTLLVLLFGLAISNLLGLVIYAGDRRIALTTQSGRDVAERIATATRAYEQSEPQARQALTHATWSPGFSVSWSMDSAISTPDGGWRTRLIRSAVSDALDDYPIERILVYQRDMTEADGKRPAPRPALFPWMGEGVRGRHMQGMDVPMAMHRDHMVRAWQTGNVLEVAIQLSDESWLNFAVLRPHAQPIWWSGFVLSIIAMTVIVVLLSLWALRSATAPLATFARAAERLGADVNAPPVPEDGPGEVRRLALAFNRMQSRIRNFVHDRTQMLAAISHDLRTPITRLRLRADSMGNEEQRRKMLQDLEQMERMIEATLSFARDDVMQEAHRAFDLAALLQDLCDDAADGGRSAAFRGPRSFTVLGRPLALKRAFTNLVDNALNYGHRAEIALQANDSRVTVSIDDQGPGIPEAEQERVFEPFFRLDSARRRETGGVGLGLTSVRSIVRAHGGDVSLRNRSDGGLRVTVWLPIR